MLRRMMIIGLLFGVILADGCTTSGIGYGSTTTGTDSVTFTWKSSDDVSGSMTAISNGHTYTGQYFQITSNTTVDNLAPLWVGWGPGRRMGGWYDWNAGPEFVTHYSGRVVANLTTDNGAHLRCRFQLVHPSDGMAGGGRGECQMPDGQHIDAQFPKD